MSREKERAEVRDRIMHKIQTEGLEACVDGAILLCKDKDAPANARAQAISSLMRANGLFAASPKDALKDLSEMSAAELNAHAAQLERDRDEMLRALMQGDDDVFD